MYCFIPDNDGHWYIIPADKRRETYDYFEKLYSYWEYMPEDEDEPIEPEWINKIKVGISYVTFPSYEYE